MPCHSILFEITRVYVTSGKVIHSITMELAMNPLSIIVLILTKRVLTLSMGLPFTRLFSIVRHVYIENANRNTNYKGNSTIIFITMNLQSTEKNIAVT